MPFFAVFGQKNSNFIDTTFRADPRKSQTSCHKPTAPREGVWGLLGHHFGQILAIFFRKTPQFRKGRFAFRMDEFSLEKLMIIKNEN